MIAVLNLLSRPRRSAPRVPEGRRIYAIGDIHGRLDLFARLLRTIEDDNAARPPAMVEVVVLGDLIDRGPQSAEVVEVLRTIEPEAAKLIVLKGNHEAVMLDALDGDPAAMGSWLVHGGDAALRSWGVDPALMAAVGERGTELLRAARRAVPGNVLEWLDNLPLSYSAGDYLFVHAGIRPGVPLADQDPHDLLWIRHDFLASTVGHGVVVVHGHTISGEVEMLDNRIGVDTGAYRSNRLSAIGLEGEERWILST